MDTWNPAQYDKFQREREQPFFDLLSLVHPASNMRAVDLGCGTGRMTRALHEHLRARETTGIDRSNRMLEESRMLVGADPRVGPGADTLRLARPELVEGRARSGQAPVRHNTEPPGLHFEIATIEAFPGARGSFDLIFSNAALHWVEDHPALLARLAGALTAAGQLAFQVPAQHNQASHRVAENLTDVEPFRSAFNGWHRPQPVLEPHEYAALLYGLGFTDPVVRLHIYPHVLAGPEDVVEWMKGTLLTEYQRQLPAELHEPFVEAYRERMLQHLGNTRPFFFPFRRILCYGHRSG